MFWDYYINETDVFGFFNEKIFAFKLDFSASEPSAESDNTAIKFESDGNLITIEFRPEE